MAYGALKRRLNGASFEDLLGAMDQVTRPEAKRLARLHGHPWSKVVRELQRRARLGFVSPTEPPPTTLDLGGLGGIPDGT